MRILVTGASGFIGGTIARQLSKTFDVVGTGRSSCPSDFPSLGIEYLQLDLLQDLPQLDHEACIHCAGLADDQSTMEELMAHNVSATVNLIQGLSQCSIFIFISSSSVYDFKQYPEAKEEHATLSAHLSDYGRSKLLAEQAVLKAPFKSTCILRPRAVYGAGDRTLFPRIANRFKNGRISVPGDLRVLSSLTHVDNLVEVIQCALDKPMKGASIYNVADIQAYELRDVFRQIGLLKHPKVQIRSVPTHLVRWLVRVCKWLKIRIPLSSQSIDYITQTSTLNTTKLCESMEVEMKHGLEDYMRAMAGK